MRRVSHRSAAEARPLLSGAALVAVGLATTGLGTIIMMALAARALTPEEYAAFAVWWTVATLLAFVFGVFEAYLARLVVTALAAGEDPTGVTRALVGRAGALAAVLSALVLLASPWLAPSLFGGSRQVMLLLPVFLFLAATQALQRGVATGRRRFIAIASQLTADGVTRAALAGLLVLVGEAGLESMAAATCVAVLVSLWAGGRGVPGWFARPQLRGVGVSSRPILLLLVGAVGPVLSNSASAPWLAAADTETALTVGAFAGALTLSRIPTQFASAAFGPLLAQLSHSVETHDRAALRRVQGRADVVAVGCAFGFVLLFASAGPWILSLYLGPRYSLPVGTLALLAVASGLMLWAVVIQASLAALERWSTIARAWSAGTVTFVVALLLPFDALLIATVAPVAAVAVAVMSMLFGRYQQVAEMSGRFPAE